MKTALILLMCLIPGTAFCVIDTLTLSSKITDVTIFFSGAQITRQIDLKLTKGKHILLVDKLPQELDAASLKVNGISKVTILNVKHQLDFNNETKKSIEETAVQNKIDACMIKMKECQNKLNVFEMEETLLMNNSILKKKDEGSAISDIREAADFYRLRLNEIKQGQLNLANEIDKEQKNLQSYYTEMNQVTTKNRKTYSQVYISISCEDYISDELKLTYFISGAGWEPLYDFRVDDITKPLTIVYNAGVYQSTGEDWKNVNIKLSTTNPTLTGSQPELKSWYLGRTNPYAVEVVKPGTGAIRGTLTDKESGEVLPFVNVILEKDGQMITGAVSDIDGQFLIKPIPTGYYNLKFSSLGYEPVQINSLMIKADQTTFQSVMMQSNAVNMATVEVSTYRTPLIDAEDPSRVVYSLGGTYYGDKSLPAISGRGSRIDGNEYYIDGVKVGGNYETTNNISNTIKTNITNLEYEIEIPYTILSDGQDNILKIKEVKLDVNYIYNTVPKLSTDAFLLAEITDWAELNLLTGKSNIYFQGTFTGSSMINANYAGDTLKLSLGRDNNIIIKREGNKELSDKRIIGSTVKETVAYDITLRNNRNAKIKIVVEDQFPLSDRKSIEVERLETTGAKVEDKTGKVSWEINLEPNEKKVLTFKYSVKYPEDSGMSF